MTQAFNLSQLANNLNTAGQLDATDGLTGAVPVANGGTGLTSVGTSGNVLTSNGSSWVSSAPPSPAPTTAQVLSATAGASVGDVGTYAFLRTEPQGGSDISAGSTTAGSTLRYTNGNTTISGGGLSGTWRAMGYANNYNGNGNTLYLRIS